MTDSGAGRATIDELLDRAVNAINRGDRATADALAGQVLAVDRSNVDAEELLAAPADHGEIRRISIMFTDLVDSTALSTRIEPESYRTVVGRYRDEVLRIVEQYGGHIGNTKGDGLLAVFGHPQPHEDDVQRAVQAGIEITREVTRLSERVRQQFGFDINVRVGVHRGLVYLDTAQDDVYGFAANLAARLCSIADPGTVAVSEVVERLARDRFEFQPRPPQGVKGVDGLIMSYRPTAEREIPRASPGPLVGRGAEITYLESAWAGSGVGQRTVAGVAFCGEPGIGKSRLTRVAIELAERTDGVILELFGSAMHSDVGLHPVRKLLERRCRITRGAAPEERLRLLRTELRTQSLDSEATVALLAPVLGIPSGAGYEPIAAEGQKLHDRIAQAIHEYLLACTSRGRGLVLAEDMHWFDPSTSEIVRSLLTAEQGRILVVMTSRELASLPRESNYQVFQLKPLTDAETDTLIAALHPGMPDSARIAVRRRCDGVPLYIEEVVAKLKEQPEDSADSARVPDTLYEALFARLRSSDRALRVVVAAATIGSQFDRGLLRAVVAMSEPDLDRVLAELQVTTVLEALDDNAWRFRHELLREVAAELLPPSIRQRLHGRVADALVSASSQDWPLIAAHFEQANRFDDAVSAYQQASVTARHRGALEEAVMYLSRALTLLDQLPQGPERDRREMRMRLRRGFLASAIEGPGSVGTAQDFERCLHLGGADPYTDEMFWTLQALFTYYVSRADMRRAQQIVETLRISLDDGRQWWRAEIEGGAGTLSFLRGEFADAGRYFEQAQSSIASRAERDFEAEWFMPYDAIVLHFTSLAHSRWVLGDLAGAQAALELSDRRGAELAFPQGPFSVCYARWVHVWLCLEAGLFDRAVEVAADMIQQAERHSFDQWAVLGAIMHSTAAAAVASATGDVNAPEITNTIAGLVGWAATSRFVGATGWVTFFDGQAARLLIATGRLTEARDQLNLGLQLAQQTGMSFYDAELIRLRAATRDNPDDSIEDLATAFALACRQGTPVFALRAALDDYRLRGNGARQSVREAVALFPAGSTWPELAAARALLR